MTRDDSFVRALRRGFALAGVLAFASCFHAMVAWSDTVTCGTTATEIGDSSIARRSVVVGSALTNTNTVYLGFNRNITASGVEQAIPLEAGNKAVFEGFTPGESLFCIIGSGSQVINFEERPR